MRALLRGGDLNGREEEIDAAAPFRWFRDDKDVWHEYEHHPEVSEPDLAKYDYTGRSKDSGISEGLRQELAAARSKAP